MKTVQESRKNSQSREYEVIDDFIKSHSELSWVRPVAGLIGLCKLNIDIEMSDGSHFGFSV